MLTINQVCEKYGLSHVYVHRMITKGTLKAELRQIPGSTVKRWEMDESEVERWRKDSKQNRRSDGRSRYVMHATPAELAELEGILKDREIGVIVTRQNKVKKVS